MAEQDRQRQTKASWLGRTIAERFEVLEAIGRGGMAEVYRAHDRVLTRDVAMKILRTDTGRTSFDRPRLLAEARTIARLWHPHIVAVHDVGTVEEDVVYIVMELLLGCSVADLLEGNEPIDIPFALEIGSQAAFALCAAHDIGVLHRDVKPENLYLVDSPTGTMCKLLDFSVARAPLAEKGKRLTTGDMIFGTPYYMAPEQIDSADVSPAADIYGLGVVMFEMLTGDVPFSGETAFDVLRHHQFTDAPRVDAFLPDLPIGLADLVEQMMSKEPDDRPAGADEVGERLAAMLEAMEERRIRRLTDFEQPAGTAAYSTLVDTERATQPTYESAASRATDRDLPALLDLDGGTLPYGRDDKKG